jgi:hypothetical protein
LKSTATAIEQWRQVMTLLVHGYMGPMSAVLPSRVDELLAGIDSDRELIRRAMHDAPAVRLNPTQKRILSLCRSRALPAKAIDRKLGLSAGHVRRVLGKMMKAELLTNGPDGYRTRRAT